MKGHTRSKFKPTMAFTMRDDGTMATKEFNAWCEMHVLYGATYSIVKKDYTTESRRQTRARKAMLRALVIRDVRYPRWAKRMGGRSGLAPA